MMENNCLKTDPLNEKLGFKMVRNEMKRSIYHPVFLEMIFKIINLITYIIIIQHNLPTPS